MTVAQHLHGAGLSMIVLAAAHLLFGRVFAWKEELARLSLLNRQMFLVHTFFIGLVLVMMGALSLWATDALLEGTRLARLVCAGIAAFWGCRLYVQFFVYDRSLWRGQWFNTAVHCVFSAMWAYYAGLYSVACWLNFR